MPNPVFTYILNIYDSYTDSLDTHSYKWSNSFISNNSIWHKTTKLNNSKYCYVSLTIPLNTSHLFTHSSIFNNSIKHKSFVCIQFKWSDNSIWPIGPYQVLPLWTRVDPRTMAIKGYSASPKLQHYWRLTIRLFSVISRTPIGGRGGLTPLQKCSLLILQSHLTRQYVICKTSIHTHKRKKNFFKSMKIQST